MTIPIQVTVNGQLEALEVEPHESLLGMLRERLDLTGAKEGCNEGECGACVVLLDGRAVNSCLVLAVEANGRAVTTIEGLGHAGALHPLQQAFLEHRAVQCGFCSPGMIMGVVGFLEENPNPSDAEILARMNRYLCRCSHYPTILRAIRRASSGSGK
jgi:aerobic-type carbon monoxide dehydrogenase small subunit (CoxS/CutS family)